MNVQMSMKELRILKQEELAMVNLASKISDQLNRLKVEELALQNMVRLQNEELERKSRGSQRSINTSLPIEELSKGGDSDDNFEEMEGNTQEVGGDNEMVQLDLAVNPFSHNHMENEEEEEDDEDQSEMEQYMKGL